MRVAIFGCGGAIGSRLVDWLLEHDDVRVTGADVDHRRVAHQLDNPRFAYFNSDLEYDRLLTDQLVRAADIVVDLVAVGPAQRALDPLRVVAIELQESLRIAECCAEAGRVLVQLSGGEIFPVAPTACGSADGAASDGAVDERGNPIEASVAQATRSLHAASREMLEHLLAAFGEIHGLHYVVVRPFNMLGVRSLIPPCEQSLGTDLLSYLVDDLVHGRAIMVPDDNVRRSFVSVDDVVDCIGRVILGAQSLGSSLSLNIGNPQNEASIADLATLVRELYGARHWDGRAPLSHVERVPAAEFPADLVADLTSLRPDVTPVQARLRWRPAVSLEHLTAAAVDEFVAIHRRSVGS